MSTVSSIPYDVQGMPIALQNLEIRLGYCDVRTLSIVTTLLQSIRTSLHVKHGSSEWSQHLFHVKLSDLKTHWKYTSSEQIDVPGWG